LTDIDSLKKEIYLIRKQGYAIDNEECEEGVRCIAVPVFNFSGEIIAGLSISAPVSRLGYERTEQIIQYLKNISVEASKELGWNG